MFCRHTRKLLSETITESQAELAQKVGITSLRGGNSSEFFVRKHIQVFECTKCGRLQRFVESC